ncbi:uncharacterized protein LOC133190104 [Saccostrea echinata]|uniref:uncharacterized protein LOC133190104 n=1 Tax=Saccostrea echinata TaxID=191078 RepID=UPI002A83204E|nr:uncharacterized protein LOC133190104 [Saccostrea echinata]
MTNTSRFIFLLCVVTIVDSQIQTAKMKNSDLTIASQEKSRCLAGACAGIPYEKIQNLYRGIFYTKNELQMKLKELNSYTSRTSRSPLWQKKLRKPYDYSSRFRINAGSHDGDHCCPTYCDLIFPPVLNNTVGVPRYIVHFPDSQPEPMYQFIPRGRCVSGGNCKSCEQEYAIHSLLVIDMTGPPYFEFDDFYLKSYCSCKG